jgi:hypothetical protein
MNEPIKPKASVSLDEVTPTYHKLTVSIGDTPLSAPVHDRAAEIGFAGIRQGIIEACKALPAVANFLLLQQQIVEAKAKVETASKGIVKAESARTLLQSSIESDLATKLRNIATEREAHEKDKLAGEADLQLLVPLRAKHWPDAALAIHTEVASRVGPHAAGLKRQTEAAMSAVQEACDKLAALVSEGFHKAILELVVPLMPELTTLKEANSEAWNDVKRESYAKGFLKELMGAMPEECEELGPGHYRLKPPQPARQERIKSEVRPVVMGSPRHWVG